jgi:penicillin-binding protein 1C
MAQAYAALARGGLSCTARAVAVAETDPRRVFSPEVAFLVTDVLSDENLRIAAFGPANALLLGFPVAVKTGTSSNWRDSWAVGYTSRYTVAVWTGDFEGRSMNHLAGATGAGPLFHSVMSLTVARDRHYEPEAPRPPHGVVATSVCPLSGKRPSAHCPHQRTVHMLAEDVPEETCTWHQPVRVDLRNGLRAGEHCPEEHVAQQVFDVLPAEYADWQAESGAEVPPMRFSPHCPANGPVPGAVVITYPREGEVFVIEPGYDRATQTLELAADAESLVERVTWSVNGKRLRRSAWPYAASWRLAPGHHVVSVAAPGQRGDSVAIEVR